MKKIKLKFISFLIIGIIAILFISSYFLKLNTTSEEIYKNFHEDIKLFIGDALYYSISYYGNFSKYDKNFKLVNSIKINENKKYALQPFNMKKDVKDMIWFSFDIIRLPRRNFYLSQSIVLINSTNTSNYKLLNFKKLKQPKGICFDSDFGYVVSRENGKSIGIGRVNLKNYSIEKEIKIDQLNGERIMLTDLECDSKYLYILFDKGLLRVLKDDLSIEILFYDLKNNIPYFEYAFNNDFYFMNYNSNNSNRFFKFNLISKKIVQIVLNKSFVVENLLFHNKSNNLFIQVSTKLSQKPEILIYNLDNKEISNLEIESQNMYLFNDYLILENNVYEILTGKNKKK